MCRKSIEIEQFSIKTLTLLTDGEIRGIPPVHTEENQQNTKYKKKYCK